MSLCGAAIVCCCGVAAAAPPPDAAARMAEAYPDGLPKYMTPHERLLPIADGQFVTAVYGIYDHAARTLQLSTAGHPPPLIHRAGCAGAEVLEIEPIFPLGVLDYDTGVPTVRHALGPGDRVLFFTDGVTECMDPRGRMYGTGRLTASFARLGSGGSEALLQQLVDDVGWLREQTPLPICIGFGISRPEHVRMLAPVADGLIVGSAIVRRIAQLPQKSRQQVLAEIADYVTDLLAAM